MPRLDAEETKYLSVAMLYSIQQRFGNESELSLSLEEIEATFKIVFELELPKGLAEEVLSSAITSNSSFRYISSRYAQTRYVIGADNLRGVSSIQFEALQIWDDLAVAGHDWMLECVKNILGDSNDQMDVDEGAIPAADRYVSRGDNQREFEETQETLLQVREAVRGSNEGSDEEKLIALSEIAIFEEGLAQPRLAHDLIVRFLGFCKERLVNIIGDALTALVTEKLAALIALFLALS